jgi:hypothetical protein
MHNLMHLARILTACATPAVLLTMFAGSPYTLTNTCTGVGLSGGPQWISCAGGCDGASKCKVGSGSDAIGGYKYCGCEDSSHNIEEPACCHLVARAPDANHATPWLDVRGVCTTHDPECAEVDGLVCTLAASQPACKAP